MLGPPIRNLDLEYPLGHLKGIAIDSEGRIYCGLQSYSRVQVYDDSGKFLKGWPVNTDGGAFRIRINSKDQLEVATVRTDMLYIFDSQGRMIDQKSSVDLQYFNEFGEKGEHTSFDTKGNLYLRLMSSTSANVQTQIENVGPVTLTPAPLPLEEGKSYSLSQRKRVGVRDKLHLHLF